MVNFNTPMRPRRSQSSPEQVFRAFPYLTKFLKSGLLATLFWCCLFAQDLKAQCDIACIGPAAFPLNLDPSGVAVLNDAIFVGKVSSSNGSCSNIKIWEDAAMTIPYKTSKPGPIFTCSDISTFFTVYVTLDDGNLANKSGGCAFTVTIGDNLLPVIDDPNDTTYVVDPNTCASVQTLTATASDNCALTLTHTLSGATLGGPFPGFTATHAYDVGATTITWKATDAGGNMSTASTLVTVTDNQLPTISCPANIAVNNDPGLCSAVVAYSTPGISDNCPGSSLMLTAGLVSGSAFPVGITTVSYKVTDASGNMQTCSFTVTVTDNQAPVFAGPFHPSFPANGGMISISPSPDCDIFVDFLHVEALDVTDNCPFTLTHTINGGPSIPGGNANGTYGIGTYVIVYTAKDAAGNTTTYTVTLMVEDLNPPIAVCQDITVEVNSAGLVYVKGSDIDGGSSDNCLFSFKIAHDDNMNGVPDAPFTDSISFNCSDIGPTNTVILQVIDASNNTATCIANVVVEDNEPPVAKCKDIMVTLDEMGNTLHTVLIADIENGSFDNCTPMGSLLFGISELLAGPYGPSVVFDCGDVTTSPKTVFLEVTDAEGNVNFCQSLVTVKDNIPPIAICQNIAVNLDGSGNVSILASQVDDGSFDPNCSIASMSVSPSSFTCANIGMNTVTLTVTDIGGNTSTCTATVTVVDNTPPTALCKPAILPLDAFGAATLSPSMVNNNSTDNCPPVSLSVSPSSFTCANIGMNTVTLTVTDPSMNSSTCTAAVTVVDNSPPVAVCTPIFVALQSNGEVPVFATQVGSLSDDNCSAMLLDSISVDTTGDGDPDSPFALGYLFDCDDIGPNVVAIKVTDGFGNFAICETTVTIQDNEDPTIICPPDLTLEWLTGMSLDPLAIGSVVVIDPAVPGPNDGLADDNCEVEVDWEDIDTVYSNNCHPFPMGDGWVFYIRRVWTAEDGEGNIDTCHQIIRLKDTTIPSFTAPGDIVLDCPDSYTVANHACTTFVSTNVPPVNISPVGMPTITDTIQINLLANGKITDVNVSVQISHTWTEDLDVQLEYYVEGDVPGIDPATQIVTLFNDLCGSNDNVDLVLDDEGLAYVSIPCPMTDQTNTYHPSGNLSGFDGKFINGTWLLRVFDDLNQDGGALTSWSLDICYIPQPEDTTITGGVVGIDGCDTDPDESFKDYQAFKDFAQNTANTLPMPTTYDFSFGAWTSSLPAFTTTSTSPSTLTLQSHTSSSTSNNFTIAIPKSGWVSFDYVSTSSVSDPFSYSVAGTPTILGATVIPVRVVVPVSMGQIFGFHQGSNGSAPHASTTISNFVYVDAAICPVPAFDCPREFCIARLWDVTDACWNMAPTQLQIIRTRDITAPDIDFPDTVMILAQNGICSPQVNLNLTPFISDSPCTAAADLILDNDAFENYGIGDNEGNASGFYAPGTYTITFTAEDECGNEATHVVTLVVKDVQNPTAICNAHVIVSLNGNPSVVLPASAVNLSSSDNCSGLTLSVSPNTFDTPGDFPVTLTVTDASGNTSTCPSLVTVLGKPTFFAGDASGSAGGMALVPVTVESFEDLTSFSFDLDITDGSVASIVGIQDVHPALSAGTFLPGVPTATHVSASWFDSQAPIGQDLPDGTVIFNLKVNLGLMVGSSTPVTVTNTTTGQLVNGGPGSTTVPSMGMPGTITVIDPGASHTIAGTLKKEPLCGSVPIELVTMNLTGSTNTTFPNAPGAYSFVVPAGSNVTVTPMKNINWMNGVTAQDAQCVQQFFSFGQGGMLPPCLPSFTPYQIIAADANKDNQVTIFDASLIQQLSIGFIPNVPGNTSWRFVSALPALPANPFTALPFNESISRIGVASDFLFDDFIGIKVGDVWMCKADPVNLFGGSLTDRSAKLYFSLEDQSVVAGQEVLVTFKANDFTNLSSYQMTLNFDWQTLKLDGAIPGSLTGLTQGNFNPLRANEGLLAANWYNLTPVTMPDGSELFTLKFTALKDAESLGSLFGVTSDYIVIQAVKGDGEVLGMGLTFDGVTATGDPLSDVFALYQNRPNPFGHKTTIGFTLPQSANAKLSILDPAGRVLKVVENVFSAGYHQVIVDRDELPAAGVLFYRLETPTHQAVRKMVLLD